MAADRRDDPTVTEGDHFGRWYEISLDSNVAGWSGARLQPDMRAVPKSLLYFFFFQWIQVFKYPMQQERC